MSIPGAIEELRAEHIRLQDQAGRLLAEHKATMKRLAAVAAALRALEALEGGDLLAIHRPTTRSLTERLPHVDEVLADAEDRLKVEVARVEALCRVLAHGEQIEEAVERGAGVWVRADGQPWRCACGHGQRTLGRMRQHLSNLSNPTGHTVTNITVITPPGWVPATVAFSGEGSLAQGGIVSPDVLAVIGENGCTLVVPESSPKLSVVPEPAGLTPQYGDIEVSIAPQTEGEIHAAAVADLPYVCKCGSPFPSSIDFGRHRSQQKPDQRKHHILVKQPKAEMVPTGVKRPVSDVERARAKAYEDLG